LVQIELVRDKIRRLRETIAGLRSALPAEVDGLLTRDVLDLVSFRVYLPDVANTLAASVKIRNLIGHAYAAVDPVKLHEAANELLAVLDRFCAAVL
jgi:hypothetical protein